MYSTANQGYLCMMEIIVSMLGDHDHFLAGHEALEARVEGLSGFVDEEFLHQSLLTAELDFNMAVADARLAFNVDVHGLASRALHDDVNSKVSSALGLRSDASAATKSSDDLILGGAIGNVANLDDTVGARTRVGSSVDKGHVFIHITEVGKNVVVRINPGRIRTNLGCDDSLTADDRRLDERLLEKQLVVTSLNSRRVQSGAMRCEASSLGLRLLDKLARRLLSDEGLGLLRGIDSVVGLLRTAVPAVGSTNAAHRAAHWSRKAGLRASGKGVQVGGHRQKDQPEAVLVGSRHIEAVHVETTQVSAIGEVTATASDVVAEAVRHSAAHGRSGLSHVAHSAGHGGNGRRTIHLNRRHQPSGIRALDGVRTLLNAVRLLVGEFGLSALCVARWTLLSLVEWRLHSLVLSRAGSGVLREVGAYRSAGPRFRREEEYQHGKYHEHTAGCAGWRRSQVVKPSGQKLELRDSGVLGQLVHGNHLDVLLWCKQSPEWKRASKGRVVEEEEIEQPRYRSKEHNAQRTASSSPGSCRKCSLQIVCPQGVRMWLGFESQSEHCRDGDGIAAATRLRHKYGRLFEASKMCSLYELLNEDRVNRLLLFIDKASTRKMYSLSKERIEVHRYWG
ncbi:hypothetical protein KCU62_g39, partial [Aureobasidium sp. EXF-3399]